MRYHFVLNGYLQNCQKLMQEMKAFKEMYLSDAEEGITYLYCQSEEIAKQLNGQLTKNVSVLAAEEYVPETVLKGLEELAKPKDIYILEVIMQEKNLQSGWEREWEEARLRRSAASV